MAKIQHIIPLLTLATITTIVAQIKDEDKIVIQSTAQEVSVLKIERPDYVPIPIAIEPVEEFEVEPFEIFFESKEIDTLLPPVLIQTHDYIRCGCRPAPLEMILIPADTTTKNEDYSIFAEPIYAEPDRFDAIVYPNPTRGEATLALDIETEGQYQILMYDMNGRKIREFHAGELFMGRNNFNIDLYDLKPAMYFIQIIAEGQNETLKIQKL